MHHAESSISNVALFHVLGYNLGKLHKLELEIPWERGHPCPHGF